VQTGSTVKKPGWYPNPYAGDETERYWDGHAWTWRARGVRWSAFWKRHRILGKLVRRVLWTLYTVLFVTSLLGDFFTYWDWGHVRTYATALVYLTAVVGLVLHTWDIRTLSPSFWKAFAFGFVGYLTAMTLSAPIVGEMFPWAVVTIDIPLYIALFRYAYRDWPE